MPNCKLQLVLEDFHGIERDATITYYTFRHGYPGHGPNNNCPGCPPDPECVEDIKAIWTNARAEFTPDDYERYFEQLENACLEDVHGA